MSVYNPPGVVFRFATKFGLVAHHRDNLTRRSSECVELSRYFRVVTRFLP
jgi:hypothetical protein